MSAPTQFTLARDSRTVSGMWSLIMRLEMSTSSKPRLSAHIALNSGSTLDGLPKGRKDDISTDYGYVRRIRGVL